MAVEWTAVVVSAMIVVLLLAVIATAIALLLWLTSALLGWLLGVPRSRGTLIAACLYLGLLVSLITFNRVSLWLSRPAQVSAGSPEVLVQNLPFEGSVYGLKWSPTGRYIAIGGVSERKDNYADRVYEILIVDTDSGEVISRVPTSYPAVSDVGWASPDNLWVAAGDGWDVYSAPFRDKSHVHSRIPGGISTGQGRMWVLHPDSPAVLVASLQELQYDSKWQLQVWKEGKRLCEMDLRPQDPGVEPDRRIQDIVFSPDGSHVALTIAGWVYPEGSGREELWVLEITSGKLRFLHAGKTKSWQMWDYPVQSVRPSWASDNRTIVFGDSTFGIEEIDIFSAKRKRILRAKWAGDEVKISPTSEWIGFHSDELERMVLVTRDGKQRALPPDEYQCDFVGAWDWHPTDNILAWIPVNCCCLDTPPQLCIWRMERQIPDK